MGALSRLHGLLQMCGDAHACMCAGEWGWVTLGGALEDVSVPGQSVLSTGEA